MKKLPVGIFSFEFIRRHGYVYVDKTEHIYRLVDQGMFYFLSRPRRFGKSLLVTTLLHLFAGQKELFEGLWIAEHGDWDWRPHPVLLLDFNGIPGPTPEVLRQGLSARLKQIAAENEIVFVDDLIERQFQELILGLYRQTGMPAAVLIDEYDKWIIAHLGKGKAGLDIATANRDVLKRFFGVLKDTSIASALRFVFLTGVSKFSKVTIFSELNNLDDLTMNRNYADMMGYPNQEVKRSFSKFLLFNLFEPAQQQVSSQVLRLNRYLAAEKLEPFFEAMTAIFAAIPYDLQTKRDEAYYHTLFYLMLTASGGEAQSSLLTCRGRIDMVISFQDKVYIFEFKCNQRAAVALKQIEDKGYADRYKGSGLAVILIGVNFNPESRNLEEWQVKEIRP